MLNATMESSSGSYQYDQHLNINKTMVNTLSFALLPEHLVMYRVTDKRPLLLCTV